MGQGSVGHSLGTVQLPTVSNLVSFDAEHRPDQARTMSFTYSLPPLINSPPPVAIPYEGSAHNECEPILCDDDITGFDVFKLCSKMNALAALFSLNA